MSAAISHPVRVGERRQVVALRPNEGDGVTTPAADDRQLTDELARRVMGWGVHPDRYLKSGRTWIARWRFQPMKHLDHAFAVLDHAPSHYTIKRSVNGEFSALVRIGGRVGKASGAEKARAICLALGQALQLDGFDAKTSHMNHRPKPARRKEPK